MPDIPRTYNPAPPAPAAPDWSVAGPELAKALRHIKHEADTANEVIRLGRSGSGQGRIRVATALHRIAKQSAAALSRVPGEG